MKKLLFAFIFIVSIKSYFSQNVGIGNNNPQSKLHVSGAIRSDTLIGPGVRNLFASPNGRIYDSLVIPSTLNWEITGNSNITAINFLGTTNAADLIFRTNNLERGRFLSSNGNFGLGTLTPNNKLEITSAIANASGLRFTNLTSASPTVVANGRALTVDINGDVVLATALSTAWDLLGNAGTNAAVNFLGTTDNNDLVFRTNNIEHVRVLTNGNVGVGTNAPTERLHVNGNIQLGNPVATSNALGDKLYMSATFNNTDDFWTARFNKLPDESEWRFNIADDAISPTTTDRIVFGRTTFPASVWQPLMDILNDGRVGIGTSAPRGKFDVMNGDAYVADNVYPQNSFNVGRSINSIFTDNIRPYTDNGFRIYDGNSPSHLHLESNTQGIIQSYNSTTSANPNALEIPGTETILSLNPTGGGVRVGIPNGQSTCINPALPDNPNHRMSVGYGYFVAGSYNSDAGNLSGAAPGTTWIGGVGALAVGMNRNAGRSHVDLWNTTDVTQVAANANIDRGFEFRGYDNAYAERTMARLDGLGQFFSNGTFAISDKRFKTDITPFNELVLDKLMKVKTYNYKMHQPVTKNGGTLEKGSVVKQKDFGVLVQDFYELFPTVVYKPADESKEPWSVDYSRFSLYLLEGMKEQQDIIMDQKKEINELKSKYNELLNRISKLESK